MEPVRAIVRDAFGAELPACAGHALAARMRLVDAVVMDLDGAVPSIRPAALDDGRQDTSRTT
jgi:hypothetical protein